jgi:hypothetical protein
MKMTHHSRHHLLQESLGDGRDADVRVHLDHRTGGQVASVALIKGNISREDFF